MTLVCKPKGKGNWNTIIVTISLAADLFRVTVGQTIPFGDLVLRVCEVRP